MSPWMANHWYLLVGTILATSVLTKFLDMTFHDPDFPKFSYPGRGLIIVAYIFLSILAGIGWPIALGLWIGKNKRF